MGIDTKSSDNWFFRLWSRFEFRLAFFSFLIHLPFILFDGLFLARFTDGFRATDYREYIDRTRTILRGGVLYRDTRLPTRTPPLASYFLLPVLVLGRGYIVDFEIYFSLIDVMTSIMIYKTLLNRGEVFAKKCSIFYAFHPLVIISSTIRVQDECIVALFFIIITFLFTRKRYYVAATVLGLGIMTKPVIVLILPLLIFAEGNFRTKILRGLISIGVALLIFTPFYFFAREQIFAEESVGSFIWLSPDGTGLSALLVNTHGYSLPVVPFIVLFTVTYFVSLYFIIKKKFSHWFAFTTILCFFFITFTKIHASYYLYILVFASPFILTNRRLLNEFLLILTPTLVFLHMAKSVHVRGILFWLVGGILAWIIVTAIIIHLLVIVLKSHNNPTISPFERIQKQEDFTHILDKRTFILAYILTLVTLVLFYL